MGESYVRKPGEYLEGWDAGDTQEHISPTLTGPLHTAPQVTGYITGLPVSC